MEAIIESKCLEEALRIVHDAVNKCWTFADFGEYPALRDLDGDDRAMAIVQHLLLHATTRNGYLAAILERSDHKTPGRLSSDDMEMVGIVAMKQIVDALRLLDVARGDLSVLVGYMTKIKKLPRTKL